MAPSRYTLGSSADLNVILINRIEAHTRAVAKWAGSNYSNAQVTRISIKKTGGRPGTIGLCWQSELLGMPGPRRIWVDSSLSLNDETRTLIHEFAHAFTSSRENHGPLFRTIYLISWALYFDASSSAFREEARYTLQRYSKHGFWGQRKELKTLRRQLTAAKAVKSLHS